MKLLKILIPFFIIAVISGCGGGQEADDGMGTDEITALSESQVSNFIYVLPEVLDFSEAYFSRATPAEKESPDANRKYLEALKTSVRIKESVETHGYVSVDEFMLVYKNVVLEYTAIKRELTNDAAISSIFNKIQELKSEYAIKLANAGITAEEEKKINAEIENIAKDEIRYRNILLVKKYESALDQVSKSQDSRNMGN